MEKERVLDVVVIPLREVESRHDITYLHYARCRASDFGVAAVFHSCDVMIRIERASNQYWKPPVVLADARAERCCRFIGFGSSIVATR